MEHIKSDCAAKILLKNDNILILTHDHPDGDTLGSAYALCRGLHQLGKKAAVLCTEDVPETYSFMWAEVEVQCFEPDFIVTVDVADAVLLGAENEEKFKDKINLNIDHHSSNNLQADFVVLESTAAATAEIVFDILKYWGVKIDIPMADCIFTGISTDTGCFRYSNTTARSHNIAAFLIEAGANSNDINQTFFETKTRVYAALERLALDSLTLYFDGACAVITVTQSMLEQSGATASECDRISALPRQIEGVKVGVTLRETQNGSFKASIRTNGPVNAAELAGKLGGGGHVRAAGCQLEGPLEKALENLLRVVEEEIS
ncbi:MAG: DHH family phosphoesterase [Acutalibacteraceae bacterium]